VLPYFGVLGLLEATAEGEAAKRQTFGIFLLQRTEKFRSGSEERVCVSNGDEGEGRQTE